MGDLCHGTKHAELDRRPWNPDGVSVDRALHLHGTRGVDGRASAKARHTVRIGARSVPLLDLIGDAIALWDSKFRDLKVGAYGYDT